MEVGRILPTEAAVILNVSPQFIRIAMQQGKLPIGTAVQMSSIWTYHISEKLLADYSGKDIQEFDARMQRIDEKREASGQNAMLEQVRTWQQVQDTELDKYAVFDTMSADWGGEEDGFVFYEIPEEYSRTGGYFPEKMQVYTYCVCKQYGVRYDLVVALIEKESGYKFDKIGDDGHSIGYMQIYEECHRDRMERLNVTDLTNPYQNVLVGIDYLSELIERYGTIQDALAAYNYGEQGAKQHLWKNGIYCQGVKQDCEI